MAFNIVTELGNQHHGQFQNILKKNPTPIAATLVLIPCGSHNSTTNRVA